MFSANVYISRKTLYFWRVYHYIVKKLEKSIDICFKKTIIVFAVKK